MAPLAPLGRPLIAAGLLAALAPAARASTSLRAPATPSMIALDVIRIGIRDAATELKVKGGAPLTVLDMESGRSRQIPAGRTLRFKTVGDRLEAVPSGSRGRISFADGARVFTERPGGRVIVDGKPYRGAMILKPAEDGISVVNELGLEEYLYGVLPLEMSRDWPLEALKAQAVIARSYAVYNLGRFGLSGFDLSSDQRSQVYDGSGAEDPRTIQAVDQTVGQVLAYHGTILNAYFHACCGGHTASAESIWGTGPDPYRPFQGVRDSYCSMSPHFRWKVRVEGADLLRALQRGGVMATHLQGIGIAQRDRSGYIRAVSVTTDRGRELVKANSLRQWLGSGHLKSTHWTRLAKIDGAYVIEGHGYGHGVGLCQWGARAQAKNGRDYKRILRFYYPGTTLRRLEDK